MKPRLLARALEEISGVSPKMKGAAYGEIDYKDLAVPKKIVVEEKFVFF